VLGVECFFRSGEKWLPVASARRIDLPISGRRQKMFDVLCSAIN
jgi:hypothetical protein